MCFSYVYLVIFKNGQKSTYTFLDNILLFPGKITWSEKIGILDHYKKVIFGIAPCYKSLKKCGKVKHELRVQIHELRVQIHELED